MDGLHVQGVPKHEGDPLLRAEIGEPVPREDAFHGNHQVLAVRRDHLEKVLRRGGAVAMDENLALPIEDAEVHVPRVQIDPTVVLVLLLPPGGRVFVWPHSPYPVGW